LIDVFLEHFLPIGNLFLHNQVVIYYLFVLHSMKIGNENFLILNYFNSTKSTDEAMEARREPETD